MMSVPAECFDSEPGPKERFRAAVSEDLLALASLHDRELDRERIMALWESCYTDFLGLRLRSETGREALAQFRQGLTEIPTALDQDSLDILAAEYADIYLNHSFGASPYESVWVDEDHLLMQEPMFQIREYYKNHGLAVPNWRQRTDDHLVHQLQFLAHLFDPTGSGEVLGQAAQFMDEHILRWIGDFADRVSQRCVTRLYAGLSLLTDAYLQELREVLVILLGRPRPTSEEIDQRMRPQQSIAIVESPGPYVPGAEPSW